MNVLAAVAAALKSHGALFGAWIGLCFATVLLLRVVYDVELEQTQLTGMAIFWGLVLLAGAWIAARARRPRAAVPSSIRGGPAGGTP
jgi:hypothetical protein